MRIGLIVVGLLWAAPLWAQTHPCDAPGPAQITLKAGETFGVGFCHDGKDTTGAVQPITSFRVTLDGAQIFTGILQPIGVANAAGKKYYETPKTQTTTPGNHTSEIFTSNAAGEGAAITFPFTVVAAVTVPSAASSPRLIK